MVASVYLQVTGAVDASDVSTRYQADSWSVRGLVSGDLLPNVDLPLGWTGGVACVFYVFLDDLRSASQLKGVPAAAI